MSDFEQYLKTTAVAPETLIKTAELDRERLRWWQIKSTTEKLQELADDMKLDAWKKVAEKKAEQKPD